MTIEFRLDGALLPYQTVRLTGGGGGVQGLPSAAWYCEPMTAGIVIDDVDGTLDIDGWHTFTVEESACTSAPRLFTGWITGKSISRGPYRIGAGRQWNCDIIDQNALFSFEVFRASSAKRPAETDVARMQFMIASAPMAFTPVADNGRFSTANPVNFGDADYVTQYPSEMVLSVAGTAGKNAYAYWDQAAREIAFHYDLVDANPACTLRISNVSTDIDSTTTFGPLIDAELVRSPEDVYTGILFGYRGGYAYGRRQATIDDLSPSEFSPTEFHRDLVYRSDRVGRLATAQALVASMLEAKANEQDTITVTVQLPATKVGLVDAGMKIDVKFSHLPGYEAFTSLAIIRRDYKPTDGHDALYDVRLELSNASAPRGPGGGDPGGFPPEPEPCDLAWVQSSNINVNSTNIEVILPFTPTIGNTVVLDFGMRTTGLIIDLGSAWTDLTGVIGFAPSAQDFAVQRFYKVWDADDVNPIPFDFDGSGGSGGDNNFLRCLATELSGAMTPFVTDTETTDVNYCAPPTMCGTVTVDSGTSVLLLGVASIARNVSSSNSFTPNGSATEAIDISQGSRVPMWLGYELTTGTGSGQSMSAQIVGCPGNAANGYGGILTAFVCTSGDPDAVCIESGQPSPEDEAVTPPTGDGTTTTFTTRCPFADETLHVKVDNLNQDAAVASYDGAAGTFTLGFAPVAGEQVTVNYLGR